MEYTGMLYLVPVPFNFEQLTHALFCYANQHLNLWVVKQLEPYIRVSEF
jgi:hypothetical protein